MAELRHAVVGSGSAVARLRYVAGVLVAPRNQSGSPAPDLAHFVKKPEFGVVELQSLVSKFDLFQGRLRFTDLRSGFARSER